MKRLLAGSAGLVMAIMVVNAGNYGLNLLLANALDPSDFGDASLLVTVLLVTGVLAGTLQLATSVATIRRPDQRDQQLGSMRLLTNRVGWVGGLLLGAVSPLAADILHVESRWALFIMAAGFPLHLQLAVERGRLQGDLFLGRLAGTFVAEGVARIVATIAIVSLAPSVGALAVALNVGFLGGYLVCRPRLGRWSWLELTNPGDHPPVGSVGTAVVAVTLITNLDVVAAKCVFDPATAGGFAALALGGRVVFFASWTLQQALLPLVIAEHATIGRELRQKLFVGGNALVCAVLVVLAWGWSDRWITLAFGATYSDLAPLLGPYALGTGVVSVAAAVAVIRSTEGNDWPSRFLLGGAVAVGATLLFNGETLKSFIDARLLSVVLLAALVITAGNVSGRFSNSVIGSCRSGREGAFS